MSVLALMGLLPPGAAVEGRAVFDGRDLLRLSPAELRRICGRELAMVFQDPMTSLHPMLSVGTQLTEHVRSTSGWGGAAAARAARAPAGGADPRSGERADAFRTSSPAACASGSRSPIALACRPTLLVADEPTTALDVTVQAGIIRLLDRLRRESGLAIVLITHDLGVLSAIADRVAVFYAGRIVEAASAATCSAGRATRTRAGLLDALPHPEAADARSSPSRGAAGAAAASRPGAPSTRAARTRSTPAARSVPPLVPVNGRTLACPVDPFRDGADGIGRLALEDVVVEYERRGLGPVRAVAGASLEVAQRADRRPRRRVRLRQVDARAGGRRDGGAARRDDPLRGP